MRFLWRISELSKNPRFAQVRLEVTAAEARLVATAVKREPVWPFPIPRPLIRCWRVWWRPRPGLESGRGRALVRKLLRITPIAISVPFWTPGGMNRPRGFSPRAARPDAWPPPRGSRARDCSCLSRQVGLHQLCPSKPKRHISCYEPTPFDSSERLAPAVSVVFDWLTVGLLPEFVTCTGGRARRAGGGGSPRRTAISRSISSR